MNMRTFAVVALLASASAGPAADPVSGWRGNMTGLWPDAHPPVEWHRLPLGAMDGLRASAEAPAGAEHGNAPLVSKGLVRDWLVVGPFPVADPVKDFDRDLLGGEADARPKPGDKVRDLAWKPLAGPADDIMVFGTAELPWLDVGKAVGAGRNQAAYAHTYLYSPRGGPVRGAMDHSHGLKVWVNGQEAYRSTDRAIVLCSYPNISKLELNHSDQPSPHFQADLKPGWNRLLLKLGTSAQDGTTEMRCCLRLMDPPDVKYDTKNILWMTPLPGRSTSTPIIVGDRLFVMAEPDELLCLDKGTGKVLWSAFVNLYEALPPAENARQPAYAERVDPLIAKLKAEADPLKRTRLRADIQKALVGIDADRFRLKLSDHFEAHFGIVGFTMPTPVSDGTHVYVWSGMGVAACFDLAGRRQWITRVKTDELNYGSSPVLAEGVLVVFLNGLYGLDAKTGKQLWQQKKVRNNVAALLGATVAGRPVVVTQRGDLVRPKDGEILFRPKDSTSPGDTGWAPPVILKDRMYLGKYGVTTLGIWDLSAATADNWEPRLVDTIHLPEGESRRENGGWLDRWTAGSPLVWEGMAYQIDIYQRLYALELATRKMYYRRDTALDGLMHYNAVPVAASPTLVGENLLVCDNQGTTLVIRAGQSYRTVSRNRIGTVMDRRWPLPAQETLTYAPPLADGNRLYLRGERYLYCVGEK